MKSLSQHINETISSLNSNLYYTVAKDMFNKKIHPSQIEGILASSDTLIGNANNVKDCKADILQAFKDEKYGNKLILK